jgi:outer membrane lipoprotein SlyB
MKKILITTGLTLSLMMLSGCAPKGINSAQVGQQMIVKPGVVQSVQIVTLNTEGVGNALGGVLGAVAGAAAGNQVGGGTGRAVATAAGAVAGGVLGGMAGDSMDTNYGQQIAVKLDNGETVGTVLRLNGATAQVSVGQAVNVFYTGGKISNITAR